MTKIFPPGLRKRATAGVIFMGVSACSMDFQNSTVPTAANDNVRMAANDNQPNPPPARPTALVPPVLEKTSAKSKVRTRYLINDDSRTQVTATSAGSRTGDGSKVHGARSDSADQGVVEAGRGYTVIRRADGSVVRREGARNWRNNNPGNIEYGDFAKNMGAVGSDGRFAVFLSYEAGRKAKEKLLFEGKNYKDKTIAEAINRYAPPSENNTQGYINSVTGAVGVSASTPLSSLSPDQRRKMLDAMERVEGFKVGQESIVSIPRMGNGGD